MCRSARDVERGDNVNHEVYHVLPVVDAWGTRIPHVVGTVYYECNVQQTSCNVRHCTTSAQYARKIVHKCNAQTQYNIMLYLVTITNVQGCRGDWISIPHTHPIPTEKPVGIPTVSPYLQNPEILHIHAPNPVYFR